MEKNEQQIILENFRDYVIQQARSNLSKLKNCLIVIEIHAKGVDFFSNKYNLLINDASKYFYVDYV